MKLSNAEKLLKEYYREELVLTTNNKKEKYIEKILKIAIFFNLSLLLITPFKQSESKLDIASINELYIDDLNYIKNNINIGNGEGKNED